MNTRQARSRSSAGVSTRGDVEDGEVPDGAGSARVNARAGPRGPPGGSKSGGAGSSQVKWDSVRSVTAFVGRRARDAGGYKMTRAGLIEVLSMFEHEFGDLSAERVAFFGTVD